MRKGELFSIRSRLDLAKLLLYGEKPKVEIEWTEDGKYWFLKKSE